MSRFSGGEWDTFPSSCSVTFKDWCRPYPQESPKLCANLFGQATSQRIFIQHSLKASLFFVNIFFFFKGFACTLWSIFRILLCLLNRLNILACNWLLANAFGLSKFNWLGRDGYTIVNPYGGHSLAGWLTIWHFGRISTRFFLEAFLGLLFAQTFWFMSSQDEGCWLAYRHTKIEILQKTFRAANNRKTKKKERK